MDIDDDAHSPLTSHEPPPDNKTFYGVYAWAQFFGLLSLVFVFVWTSKYLGGFGWSDPDLQFNWHPLLMVFGFVFLYGNGILVYRLLKRERKIRLKQLHAAINAAALISAIIGLTAVFGFHNAKGFPNLYSLHSWMGLLVVIMFGLQWFGGFTAFLTPVVPPSIRKIALPYHVFGGVCLFVLAAATSLLGITEKALFKLSKTYSQLPPEAWVLNLLGISIICFAATVVYLVTHPDYKRRSSPEEQGLAFDNTSMN